jgi:hypothetical protein
MSKIKVLLENIQQQMATVEFQMQQQQLPPHPWADKSAQDPEKIWAAYEAEYQAQMQRLQTAKADAERAYRYALPQHTEWVAANAQHREVLRGLEREWEQLASQFDAVSTTLKLLGQADEPTPAPTPAPQPQAAPQPAVQPQAAPQVEADTDATADENSDADLDLRGSFTSQVHGVFTRNEASTKQWTAREVALALAKASGLGNNVSPKLLKAVDNALRRLIRQGQLQSKKSSARGAVVYSIH